MPPLAARIASLPEEIRGFGSLKMASRQRTREEEKRLLDRFQKHEQLPVLEERDPPVLAERDPREGAG